MWMVKKYDLVMRGSNVVGSISIPQGSKFISHWVTDKRLWMVALMIDTNEPMVDLFYCLATLERKLPVCPVGHWRPETVWMLEGVDHAVLFSDVLKLRN